MTKLKKKFQKELLKGPKHNKVHGLLMGVSDVTQKTIQTWIANSDKNLRLPENEIILCEWLNVDKSELFEA